MVKDVVLDYMHVVCLSCMRKLIQFWVKRDSRSHLITKACLLQISRKLCNLRKNVPLEFARLPRILSELPRWKATELRQFLLSTGPVVLKGELPLPLYNHFLCLHNAIKLLSSEPSHFEREVVLTQSYRLLSTLPKKPQSYTAGILSLLMYTLYSILLTMYDVSVHLTASVVFLLKTFFSD